VGGKVRHSQCPYKSVVRQRRTGFRNDDVKFREVNVLTIVTKCATVCCRKSHRWQQWSCNCDAITLPPVAAWFNTKHEGKVFYLLAVKHLRGGVQIHSFISSALHGVNGQLHLVIGSLVGSRCGVDIIVKRNKLASAGNWATFPRSFVLWSQYRLCYTFRFVVTIPSMLHSSLCGHSTVYVTHFALWTQYRLCYTVRFVDTIPSMLHSSVCGH